MVKKEKLVMSKNGFKTTLTRSSTMTMIKSKNTLPEIILKKEVKKLGYKCKCNNCKVLGKPDIILPDYKIIIFVDGDFWHGYRWQWRKPRLQNNSEYWIKKIEGNIKRDKRINYRLKKEGWKVVRIWEHDVKKRLGFSIKKIQQYILARK